MEPVIEARLRAGEGEGENESEQAEDRGLGGADAGMGFLALLRDPAAAQAVSGFKE